MSPKILEIIYHPHPTLRKIAKEIDVNKINTASIKKFASELEATMVLKDGAGLAAPQVDVSQRIIAIAQNKKKNIIMINPVITRRSFKKQTAEEGCLSVIDENGNIIYGRVERHLKISCQYIDLQGKKKKLQADTYLSRVIQHEIDHLDGILFIDRLVK